MIRLAVLQAHMTSAEIKLCDFLDPQDRLDILQHAKSMPVLADLQAGSLSFRGCRDLIAQVVLPSCTALLEPTLPINYRA